VVGNALLTSRQSLAFNRESHYLLDVEIFEAAVADDDTALEMVHPLRELVITHNSNVGQFVSGGGSHAAV
jgi:hypothetical protein